MEVAVALWSHDEGSPCVSLESLSSSNVSTPDARRIGMSYEPIVVGVASCLRLSAATKACYPDGRLAEPGDRANASFE